MDDHLRKIRVEMPKLPSITWTPSPHTKSILKGIGIMWGVGFVLLLITGIFHYLGIVAGVIAVVFGFLTLIGLAMGHDAYEAQNRGY